MPLLIPPVVEPGTIAGGEQPTIAIDRELLARPFRLDDGRDVFSAFSDAAIQRWHFRRFDTEAEAVSWIDTGHARWEAETGAEWAIVEAATDVLVGRVALRVVPIDGYGDISYWVLPAARGRSIAPRAAIAVTRWAHGDLGLHRVGLEHSVDNSASCRVATKAGFAPEGVRRAQTCTTTAGTTCTSTPTSAATRFPDRPVRNGAAMARRRTVGKVAPAEGLDFVG